MLTDSFPSSQPITPPLEHVRRWPIHSPTPLPPPQALQVLPPVFHLSVLRRTSSFLSPTLPAHPSSSPRPPKIHTTATARLPSYVSGSYRPSSPVRIAPRHRQRPLRPPPRDWSCLSLMHCTEPVSTHVSPSPPSFSFPVSSPASPPPVAPPATAYSYRPL